MSVYLLDTNIVIFYMKGLYRLEDKIQDIGIENCCISEITVAELKYGVANSPEPAVLLEAVEPTLKLFSITPIFDCLDIYAVEKARLKRTGKIIDDFDILIGATAIHHKMG